jgi:hypothetical protein
LFRVLLCGSLFYRLSLFQALWKVTLYLRCQACVFIYSSCGRWVFPLSVQFSSHCHFHKLSCSWLLGSAAAPASHHVCLQFTWEVGLPSSPVEFSSLCHSHKLSRSWLLGAHPTSATGSLAHLACLFTVLGRISFPQSSVLRAPQLLSCVSLLFLLLITQFLFFIQVYVGLSRGLCCSGPGFVCRSTVVPQSSPGPLLPMPSWSWPLAAQGPSSFLCLMWGGDSLLHLEVWRGQSYAFSQWLCLQNVSPASLQDFTIGGSLSASSLYLPSWNPIHHVCFIPSSYDGTWVDYRSQILWKLPQWALLGRCFMVMWIHFIVSCVIIQGVTLLGCFFFFLVDDG